MSEEDRGDASQVNWVEVEGVTQLVVYLTNMHKGWL